MNKFIDALNAIDPTPLIAHVLTFAVAFMLGQQTATKDVKKHYIADASKVEVVYSDPYKALTLDECVTDWECETAQLIADNRDGKLVRDDPIFTPDSIPVIEPTDGDYENTTETVGHYPTICEPYIAK